MIVHLSPADKFIEPFILFNKTHFSGQEHLFFITLTNSDYIINISDSKVFQSPKKGLQKVVFYLKLIPYLSKADGILLHSLNDFWVTFILFMFPSFRKKSCWYIWGRDLYCYSDEKKTLKHAVKEFFRKPVIRDFGKIVTYLDGDVELARKWYGAKARYYYCYMYKSNLYKSIPTTPINLEKTKVVLVGNSADPLNNHLELFDLMSSVIHDKPIDIYVPLSYGGSDAYKEKVIKTGYSLFGNRFKPLTQFMSANEYYRFLGTLSAGIFNHKRQMGMGNMISLLGLGKKVFLRTEFSSYRFFNDLGVIVFPLDSLSEHLFSEVDLSQNERILSVKLNESVLAEQLTELYKSFYSSER